MTCANCLDTGHGNKGLSPYLDCTKCEVATIRTRLNDKFPLAAKLYPDSLWGAYNEGQEPLRVRIAELERQISENRALIEAERAEFKRTTDAMVDQICIMESSDERLLPAPEGQ